MSHLNGQKVFGKVMRVTLSKHQTVALPREGLDDQLLTKGKRDAVDVPASRIPDGSLDVFSTSSPEYNFK